MQRWKKQESPCFSCGECQEEQLENGFNETEIDGMSGFIFCNRFGTVPNPQTVNHTIKRIANSYNADEVVRAKKERRDPIILPNFSCHHLRHTFCTRLCENETNLKVIQSIMWHRNIETTMDIYAEATEEKKQESFENLATKLDVFWEVLSRTDDNNLFDLQQIDNKKNLIMKNSEEYIRFINLDNIV